VAVRPYGLGGRGLVAARHAQNSACLTFELRVSPCG